jgi:hypothetical protein
MADLLFESAGEWWLPNEASRRIPGLLRLDAAGRLRIQLFDLLDDESANFGKTAQRPILYGSLHTSPLSGGTDLTHFDSFDVRRSFHSNGRSSETLVANRSYVGDVHLAAATDRFAAYDARFAGLSGWLPLSTIKREAPKGGLVRIEVGKAARLKVAVPGARIEFVKTPEVAHSEEETTVREHAQVDFSVEPPVDPGTFDREFLFPLRFLLSLALGRVSRIDALDVIVSDEGPWPTEVHNLDIWSICKKAGPVSPANTFDMLIAPPQEQELQQLLTAFWEMRGRIRKAIERVFALWEAPPRFVEIRFGAVSDALELLLRSASTDLGGLMKNLGDSVGSHLPPSDDLMQRWKLAREDVRAGESVESEELFRLSEVLEWLMRFALLRELGADMARAASARAFLHAATRLTG